MNTILISKTSVHFNIMILMLVGNLLNSQVAVTLQERTSMAATKKCYDISLSTEGAKDVALAGQNYRLYYDTDGVLLDEKSITSMLPPSYSALDLVQHHFDVDASGFGVLTYDSHLGFINLATDYHLTAQKPLVINHEKPLSIASMCFDIEEGKTPVFTWAQDHLTHTYATAFVEIAMLEGDQLKRVKIVDYKIEQNSVTSTQQADVFDLKYFPNPFTDKLNITFNESLSSDATVTVKDVFGQEITKSTVQKGSTAYILQGEGLPNGAMFIEIKTKDGQVSVMKAIKVN